MGWEQAQQDHYDQLAAQYEAHYDDRWSRQYRIRFIDKPLLSGLDLAGRDVLEAMCGSGQTTASLLERRANVTGLDISAANIDMFRRRWPQCRAVQTSITDSKLPAASFDAAVVVAGLHHLHPQVSAAIDEIHRLLKPGGVFCFMEPHRGSIADWFRRIWYRYDRLFLPNEAAVDLDELKRRHAMQFSWVNERYGGNIAFLLVLNSMVFRIPLRLKGLYTPPLLAVEAGLGRVLGKRWSCFAVCQWRKREAP